jgi:hypothetical protein
MHYERKLSTRGTGLVGAWETSIEYIGYPDTEVRMRIRAGSVDFTVDYAILLLLPLFDWA